eukprot:5954268-Pyramimonas_sp.AAC.1
MAARWLLKRARSLGDPGTGCDADAGANWRASVEWGSWRSGLGTDVACPVAPCGPSGNAPATPAQR